MGQGGGTGGLVGIWGREAVACIFAVVRLPRPAMATLSHPPPPHFTLRLPLSHSPPPLRSLPWSCPLDHTSSSPRNATLRPPTPHLLSSMHPRPRMCRLRGTLRPPSPPSPSSSKHPMVNVSPESVLGLHSVVAIRFSTSCTAVARVVYADEPQQRQPLEGSLCICSGQSRASLAARNNHLLYSTLPIYHQMFHRSPYRGWLFRALSDPSVRASQTEDVCVRARSPTYVHCDQ